MRPILIVAAMAGFLAACAGSGSGPAPAASDVYSAKAAYSAALGVAVRYNQIPRCGSPTSPPVCSAASVVQQLRKADNVAEASLDQAESVARSPSANASVLAAAVQSATAAVQVLQTILTTYGVK